MHQTSSVLIQIADLGYAQTNDNNPKTTDVLMKAYRFETLSAAKKVAKGMSKRMKISADKFKFVPIDAVWNDNFELTEVKIKEG